MTLSPTIHIREIAPGKMTVRAMFEQDAPVHEIATTNFLTAARTYLAMRWPRDSFGKIGWSANATEAVYHFNRIQGDA